MAGTWDEDKSRAHERTHGVPFETAALVFDDPLAVMRPDPFTDEERWQTIGTIDGVVLFVVHTWPDSADEPGRIISARLANARERKEFQDGDFACIDATAAHRP
jgi:uncharacterized DUF497 family protein